MTEMIAVHPEATTHRALCKADTAVRVATAAQEADPTTMSTAATEAPTEVAMATRVAAMVVHHRAATAAHQVATDQVHHKVATDLRKEVTVVLPEAATAVHRRAAVMAVPDVVQAAVDTALLRVIPTVATMARVATVKVATTRVAAVVTRAGMAPWIATHRITAITVVPTPEKTTVAEATVRKAVTTTIITRPDVAIATEI